MQQLASSECSEELVEHVQKLKYKVDGTYTLMAFSPGTMPTDLLLRQCGREIAKLRNLPLLYMMVNKMPPGVIVPPHQDWLPNSGKFATIERWHLPLVTNFGCAWWDEDTGDQHFPQGLWSGPVPYWIKHSARNVGTSERIHVIVDLAGTEPLGEYRHC